MARTVAIYECAFGPSYVEQAAISMRAIRHVGQFTGPMILFTDATELPHELDDCNVTLVHVDGVNTAQDAAGYRLRVFDHVERFPPDCVFWYIDADIVCLGPIPMEAILRDCDLNKVNTHHVLFPKTQNNHMMAQFLTSDPEILCQPALCSGVMLFTREVGQPLFAEIMDVIQHQERHNGGWEQPAVCLVLYRRHAVHFGLGDRIWEMHRMITTTPPGSFEDKVRTRPRNVIMLHFNDSRETKLRLSRMRWTFEHAFARKQGIEPDRTRAPTRAAPPPATAPPPTAAPAPLVYRHPTPHRHFVYRRW